MIFKFACYFPAEKHFFIVIVINAESDVGELLEAIKVKLHLQGRTDIKINDLSL